MDRNTTTFLRRRRPLALVVAVAGALALAAPAVAAPAVATDAAMATAAAIARAQWGTDPCGGQVTVSWTILAPQVNATSTWLSPVGGYADPAHNSACTIEYNELASWDWPKLCTVAVHEIGHLDGHDHSADPDDVMAPYYTKPLAACDTPGPGAAPAAPTPAVPASGATASSSTRTAQAKTTKAKPPKAATKSVKAPTAATTKTKTPKASTRKARARRAAARARARTKTAARRARVGGAATRSVRALVLTRVA